MNIKKIKALNRNITISLYDKDSIEDLILRGYSFPYIMSFLSIGEKKIRKVSKILRGNDKFDEYRFLYKLTFIKSNFSIDQVLSFFSSLSSSKVNNSKLDFFKIKRGNEPYSIKAEDIVSFLHIEKEYSNIVNQYKVNTNRQKYGTDHPTQSKFVQDKTKKTNLERYGAESTFLSPIIKEKSKKTSLERYGTEFPGQAEEVKAKKIKTFMEHYGFHTSLLDPAIQAQIRETNRQRYGVVSPLQSEVIREKIKNTLLETLGVDNPFKSKRTQQKIKETNLSKHGVENPLQSEIVKEKSKQTLIEKYGFPSTFMVPDIKDKAKKTNLERYGVENPMQSELVQKKQQQTNMKRYGVAFPFQSEAVKQTYKDNFLEKYGVEHPMQSEVFSEKYKCSMRKNYGVDFPYQSTEIKQKMFDTKRKNGTFSSSLPEDNLHAILIEKFGVENVSRNDNSHEEYPFAVDFYIKSLNLYIEYNGSWTHGKHFFNENSPQDQKLLEKWQLKSETSKYYKSAINVWTNKDLEKRQTAKKNNLNYVVLWNWKDVEDWMLSNFEVRKDY